MKQEANQKIKSGEIEMS